MRRSVGNDGRGLGAVGVSLLCVLTLAGCADAFVGMSLPSLPKLDDVNPFAEKPVPFRVIERLPRALRVRRVDVPRRELDLGVEADLRERVLQVRRPDLRLREYGFESCFNTFSGQNVNDAFFDNYAVTAFAVPEPTSLALAGLAGLGAAWRWRRPC